MTIGQIICDYRREHGEMSQRQFAAVCGLSNGFISMMEANKNPKTGKPMVASIETYGKIAAAMNMSLHELFSLADDIEIDFEAEKEWSKRFRYALSNILKNADVADLSDGVIDIDQLERIADGTMPLSFDLACFVADILGASIDSMVGRENTIGAKLPHGNVTELDADIVNLIYEIPQDKKEAALQYLRLLSNGGDKL